MDKIVKKKSYAILIRVKEKEVLHVKKLRCMH